MSYNSTPVLSWPGRFTLDDGRDRSPAYYFLSLGSISGGKHAKRMSKCTCFPSRSAFAPTLPSVGFTPCVIAIRSLSGLWVSLLRFSPLPL